ncbi:hypothetical protein [Moorena producens]|uniref:hypothetical protein n=1 Tax=Moorena producens TaxID=1155739 RepID=UPI003C76FA6F
MSFHEILSQGFYHQVLPSVITIAVFNGVGSREGGEMGRWGDGEMGRWGDGEMVEILNKGILT